MKRVSIFLITVALIVAIVVCGGGVVEYDLTISSTEGGEVNKPGKGTSTYNEGTVVPISATPVSGYQFVKWTGDVDDIANFEDATTAITMNADYSITAEFALEIIEIRDWYDLDAARDNLGVSYLLMNDLDSTTTGYMELASETANGGRGWKPIGTANDQFTGSFDGQGYEIRDLFINRPSEHYVGLFAHISWIHPIENLGVIENVRLVNADVTGGHWVGGLVGDNAGIVNNSSSTGRVTGGWGVGGLTGCNSGTVNNSYSTSDVTGGYYVGGLVGSVTGAATVREGIVSNSYSTGNVTGATRVGGLVGSVLGDCAVSNSYSTGSVTGRNWVGGLVALNDGGTVSNSYSTGSVTGNRYVSGLVGLNLWGIISSCYSTGTVSGDGPVGGLVGENSESTVNNSFWDIETSGQSTSAGGTGKTTAEMQDIDTFMDTETEGLDEPWDITAIAPGETNDTYTWNIVDGQTYPFLSWQAIS